MKLRHCIHTLALVAALAISGCHKQPKPQPVVPPPMLTESAMIPPLEPLPPPGVTVPPPASNQTQAQAHPNKPKRPRSNGKKPSPVKNPPVNAVSAPNSTNPTISHNLPPRITAPSDVPDSGPISAPMGHTEEAHRKQSTAQLIQSTEDNLKSVTRQLTDDEKAVVDQIRNFLAQSRSATAENDLVRAHNLAMKAHLLSDELVRP